MTTKWSGPKLPPGVSATAKPKSDGTVSWYFYHRAPETKVRTKLTQEPGPAMDREVRRLTSAPAVAIVVKPETLADICDLFEASNDHKKCALTTRLNRERVLQEVRRRWGNFENKHLSDKRFRGEIRDWRDEMSDTPSMADYSIQTLQRVVFWAWDGGKIDIDQTKRIKRLSEMRPREGKGLTSKQIEALLATGAPDEIMLFKFALYTGMRKADLCRVKWSDIDENGCIEWLHTKTAKSTKATSFYPTTALVALAAVVEACPRRNETDCLLTTHTGIPWTTWNIAARWYAWLERAGLRPAGDEDEVEDADIHFHDIRRQCIQNLIDAGCTNAQAASISGHQVAEAGEVGGFGKYATRSQTLAEEAYRKLEIYLTPVPTSKKVVGIRQK